MRALSLSGLGLYLLCCTAFYGLPAHIKHKNSINRGAAPPDVINLEQWGGGAARVYEHLRGYRCPLTREQLKRNEVVREALNAAWHLSNHNTSQPREVGGWIYQDRRGRLEAFLQEEKHWLSRSIRDHGYPPNYNGKVVVALYHVHPHYKGKDDVFEPSDRDVILANDHKVPGVVRSKIGIHVYGPQRGFWNVGPLNCR